MVSQRTRKWLWRIGYVCAAVIAVPLLLAANFFYESKFGGSTRTGALQSRLVLANAQRSLAHDIVEKLPPLDSLGPDGLRFAIHYWASPVWYGISLGGAGPAVQGTLVTVTPWELRIVEKKTFTVSRSDFDRFSDQIDGLAQGYRGRYDFCSDLPIIGFEHVRASGTISGAGLIGCAEHYTTIAATLFTFMSKAGFSDAFGDLPKMPASFVRERLETASPHK